LAAAYVLPRECSGNEERKLQFNFPRVKMAKLLRVESSRVRPLVACGLGGMRRAVDGRPAAESHTRAFPPPAGSARRHFGV